MFFPLTLAGCAVVRATFTGGGQVDVALADPIDGTTWSFGVSGVDESTLDEVFAEDHHPRGVSEQLQTLAGSAGFAGAWLAEPEGQADVHVEAHAIPDFEPCGSVFTHARIYLLLTEGEGTIGILALNFDDEDADAWSHQLPLSLSSQAWYSDGDSWGLFAVREGSGTNYGSTDPDLVVPRWVTTSSDPDDPVISGFASVPVVVQCPEDRWLGSILEVDWHFDRGISHRAVERTTDAGAPCLGCL